MNLKKSVILFIFSASISIVIYVFLIRSNFTEIYNFQHATCQVTDILSSYNKCCHFMKYVSQEDVGDNTIYTCSRRFIPMKRDSHVDPIEYCMDEIDKVDDIDDIDHSNNRTIRQLNCGICSEHSIISTALPPASSFKLNTTHLCDMRKLRCIDKIHERFQINNTHSCWINEDHLLLDTPIMFNLVISIVLFFTSLIILFVSIASVFVSYDKYRKEEQELLENDRYSEAFPFFQDSIKRKQHHDSFYSSM